MLGGGVVVKIPRLQGRHNFRKKSKTDSLKPACERGFPEMLICPG